MKKAVLFDLDGVFYRRKQKIPKAEKAIHFLIENKIPYFFLTNAPTKTREERAEILRSFHIPANSSMIYSTAYAAAKYISHKKKGARVYPLCNIGLEKELLAEGHKITEEDAEFVVVGLDTELTYKKLSVAFRNIYNGAEFIGTNPDALYPVEDGFLPGGGSIVAAIEYATGKKPFILGKPNTYLLDLLLEENGLDKRDVILVGDSLSTDYELAKRAGIDFILVLSGITSREEGEKAGVKYILDSVSELYTLKDILL